MTTELDKLHRNIRAWLAFFIVALLLSGLTAFPLQSGSELLLLIAGEGSRLGTVFPALASWLDFVNKGLVEAGAAYPFLAYGTDWLAYAHIVIAVAFIGPWRDPVRNVWVIEFGMIACVGVIPLALICGPIRGIPFFWQLIDCSFGVFGVLPLWVVHRMIRRLERERAKNEDG